MNTPPIVSREEWEAAREELLVKEKELTRARDALAAERRRMPWWPWRRSTSSTGPTARRACSTCSTGARQLIVYRFFFEPGVRGMARARLPGLLLPRRPGRPPRAPERARHHARVRLARPAAGHRALEGADGLGDPLVHDHRRLRRRLRRRRVARHQRVPPRRRPRSSAPTSSTTAATRRWAAPGATSTSRRSVARRSGRTRPEGYPQTAPYQWWTCTTSTHSLAAPRAPSGGEGPSVAVADQLLQDRSLIEVHPLADDVVAAGSNSKIAQQRQRKRGPSARCRAARRGGCRGGRTRRSPRRRSGGGWCSRCAGRGTHCA